MSEAFEKNLASYSLKSSNTIGRKYKENSPKKRTEFQRDRERIIHSTAFRRLEYKTQVFVNHEGDMYRTRLTHTIEVAQISRAVARALKINEDLTEAISLSHDLGHTPFGHAGEEVLNNKMKGKGGFNHNYQALKILTVLEKKYLDFDGLNLTFETLDGILKHNGPVTSVLPSYIQSFIDFFGGETKSQGSFEAQIAAICDDIAYNNNDIDDGLYAGLFEIEELNELEIIKEALKKINLKKSKEYRRIKYELIRKLINIMVDDLIINTKQNIQNFKIKNCNQILELDQPLVIFGDEMKNKEKNLKVFLKNKMYNHPKVKTMNFKAKKIVSDLFDLYIDEPYLLPKGWKNFKNENEKYVNVTDYISGMTDNYAINIHKKYFDLYSH